MTGRVRAPELHGAGGWINTDCPLSIEGLRGRVVLLDFWTFCCINCLRVVEELRPLERRFGDRLVVIGVHSPKFVHESDHAAVEQAVRRHRIEHPVLDDPEMEMWQLYGVRAWPTLVVIDPDGYVVGMASGEGNGEALADVIENLLAGKEAPAGAAFTSTPPEKGGPLSFPGKVAVAPDGRLAIADTGHDRVLITDSAGRVERTLDGFSQPQGVRFDGERLLVCDTVAGTLVAVDLQSDQRTVLASGMHSPWDVVVAPDASLVVAEAGLHRLLRVPRDGGDFQVLAGTRAEGLRDGPATGAHLAQPSGLTVLHDGAIAIADSEVSALRVLRDGAMTTLVGHGLFDFGATDGDGRTARLQHPLGVAALPHGRIAVADTFNSLLRLWRDGTLSTVKLGEPLNEPGGLDLAADGAVIVADTNNHRVLRVDLQTGAVSPLHIGWQDAVASELRGAHGGVVRVRVDVHGVDGHLDSSDGPPVRVTISAEPATLIGAGARTWALEEVPATLEVRLGSAGTGVLAVDITAATCTDDVCTIVKEMHRHPLVVE